MVSLTSSTSWRHRCPRGFTPSRLSRGRGQAAAGSPTRREPFSWSDEKAACFAADEKAGRTRIYECVIAAGKSHNVRSAPGTEHRVVGSLKRGQRVVVKTKISPSQNKSEVWVEIQGHGLQGWSLSESRPTGVLACAFKPCLSRKKVYLVSRTPDNLVHQVWSSA